MIYQDAVNRGRIQTAVQAITDLGDLYFDKAKDGNQADDLPKAIAFYNYALLRTKDKQTTENLISKLEDTERLFISICTGTGKEELEFTARQDTDEWKLYIEGFRSRIQLRVNDAKIGWDNLLNKDENTNNRSHEELMIQEMSGISKEVQCQMFGLLKLIVDRCIERLGKPPCKYSLLALGDIAFGYVTPYSKVEFAILLSSSSDPCLQYFRQLSHYIHIKFLNLGETPAPHTGADFFHDLINPNLSSFIDDETTNGIQLDYNQLACSPSPLGLAQSAKDRKSRELILTPKMMAEYFKPENTGNISDIVLIAKLMMCCKIDGDGDLVTEFVHYMQEKLMQISSDDIKLRLKISLTVIRRSIEYLQNQNFSTCMGLSEPFLLIKDIELVPVHLQSVIIAHDLPNKTMWDAANAKFPPSSLSTEVSFQVNLATAISYHLLLCMHMWHQGRDCIKTLLVTTTSETCTCNPHDINDEEEDFKPTHPNILRDVLGQRSRKLLIRYYSVLLPIVETLHACVEKQTLPILTSLNISKNTVLVQAHIAHRLLYFNESLALIQREITTVERQQAGATAKVLNLHKKAGVVALNMMQSHQARNIFFNMMDWKNKLDLNKQGEVFIDIWCNIADTYTAEGKSEKAIECFQDAIHFYTEISQDSLSASHLFRVYRSLGKNLHALGKFHDSLLAYNTAEAFVDTKRLQNDYVATMLIDKATSLLNCGDYKGTFIYARKACVWFQSAYGCNSPHPSIVAAYNIMNTAQQHMGKNLTATTYGYQAYKMNAILVGSLYDLLSDVFFIHDGGSVNYQVLTTLRNAVRLCITNKMEHESYNLAVLLFKLTKQFFMLNVRHMELVEAYHLLAVCCSSTHRNKECREHAMTASKMLVKLKGKSRSPVLLAEIYNIRAECERDTNNVEAADKMFDKALDIISALHQHQNNHPYVLKILFSKACMEFLQGDRELGREKMEQVLIEMNHTFGKIHPIMASAYKQIGDMCRGIGDRSSAISNYRKALDVITRILGSDTPSVQIAKLFRDLGTLCVEEKDYSAAEEYLNTALIICRNLIEECIMTPTDITTVLSHLGTIHRVNKDYEAAIEVHKEVLDIVQSIYNADQNIVAHAAFELATDYMDISMYADARMYYEIAIDKKRLVSVRDEDRLELTQWLRMGGECLELLGEHDQALKAHREAVSIRRTVLGSKNIDDETISSLGKLASVYHQQGEFRRALSLWKEALDHCQKLHGNVPHRDTIAALDALARIYREQKDFATSIRYQQKTHRMLEIRSQETQMNVCDNALDHSFHFLAQCYKALGEYRKGADSLNALLDHQQRKHNLVDTKHERPWILYNIGNAYNLAGEYEEAIPRLEESRAMVEELHIKSSDMEAKILYELAHSYEMFRKYDLSKVMYTKSLELRKTVFSNVANEDMVDSYTALGRIHCILGNFADGISCWEMCLQIQRELYGNEAALPAVASTLIQLGQAYMDFKNIEKSLEYQQQALRMLQQMFGKYRSNFHVAKCLAALAKSSLQAGHTAAAIQFAEEACTMYGELVPGHDVHPGGFIHRFG